MSMSCHENSVTTILMTNGSLMKAIIGLENQVLAFVLSGRLRQVLLYLICVFSCVS